MQTVPMIATLLMFCLLVALRRRLEDTRMIAARWEAQAHALERTATAAERTAQDLRAGLGAVIDREFDTWALTSAEHEVALLLLKGLSHKEIASLRGVGSPTVRQQAQRVYRKAGVTGRADLAAYFLEDVMVPLAA